MPSIQLYYLFWAALLTLIMLLVLLYVTYKGIW